MILSFEKLLVRGETKRKEKEKSNSLSQITVNYSYTIYFNMSKDDKDLEEIWKLFQDSNEDVQKRRKITKAIQKIQI